MFGSGHNEAGPLLDLMKVLWLMLEVQVVKRVEAVCWTSPRLDRVGSFRGEPSSVENFLLIDGFLEYLHSITFYEILNKGSCQKKKKRFFGKSFPNVGGWGG